MNAQLLESLTKLADALNLAKQDAKEANQRADPVLSLLLLPLLSEVAELEAKAKAIQSAVHAVQPV